MGYCPKCDDEMLCPCHACDAQNLGKLRAIRRFVANGNICLERCGVCGFELSEDQWFDYNWDCIKAEACECGHATHDHRDGECHGFTMDVDCPCKVYVLRSDADAFTATMKEKWLKAGEKVDRATAKEYERAMGVLRK